MVANLTISNFSPFAPPVELIDGSTGPYNSNTTIGKSANAGYQVGNLFKKSSFFKIGNSQINYTNPYYGNGAPVSLNVKNSLAYSTEVLKGLDASNDGIVSLQEANTLGNVVWKQSDNIGTTLDLNNDGKIDAGEYAAFSIYQDRISNLNPTFVAVPPDQLPPASPDGVINPYDTKTSILNVINDPTNIKKQLQQVESIYNIRNEMQNFTMPQKTSANNNLFPKMYQMIMRMMQMLMQMFFGRGFGFFQQ